MTRTGGTSPPWEFKLFVIGQEASSLCAIENLEAIRNRWLDKDAKIEVIDIQDRPEIARREQILAVPTLKRISPLPMRLVVGDLSKTEVVLNALDIPMGGRTLG